MARKDNIIFLFRIDHHGMKEVEVWVPHRISGFFQMMDPAIDKGALDPSKIGSRGGGPAITAFGKTRLVFTPNDAPGLSYEIVINGHPSTESAVTSRTVVDLMAPLINHHRGILTIHHDFELPMGCGFGSSGAGALGIAFGLNTLFELKLTDLECGRFAHIAEVNNHTGLGTVGGQFTGGLSISMEYGFPFQMAQIPVPDSIAVVVAGYGAISTKSILTDPEYKLLIHAMGKKGMAALKDRFTLENYMKICKDFVKNTELLVRLGLGDLGEIIAEVEQLEIVGISMNQLGKSLFCICDESVTEDVCRILDSHSPISPARHLKICAHGPVIRP